jgi:hypothetical protein
VPLPMDCARAHNLAGVVDVLRPLQLPACVRWYESVQVRYQPRVPEHGAIMYIVLAVNGARRADDLSGRVDA